ncbi:DEAD/DEAH box helicase [Francisella sp. 19X1-34]|uniref:DEAD/DEAH box helicase n=1 Tax=Francisella sp. 19X1-34 TaxID=3087177 RepID=UPI002E35AEAE|nr:DEAD/DEAH box helicase [Francisella sp. 19X1-34]MED7789272.1 DEAD/DEAH box helicase [Francisella sp. 19X1-34]
MDITTDLLSSTFTSKIIADSKTLLNQTPKIKITYNGYYSIIGNIDEFRTEIKNNDPYSYFSRIDNSKFNTNCSCNKNNCVHAAALALYYLNNKEQYETNSSVSSWLSTLSNNSPMTEKKEVKKSPPFELLYILSISNDRLYLNLNLARRLKSGKFGSDKKFIVDNKTHQKALTAVDHKVIFNKTWQLSEQEKIFIFKTPESEELLKQIINTGRCFYLNKDNPPIELSDPIQTKTKWAFNDDGTQYLTADCDLNISAFKISSLWYLSDNEIGLIQTDIEENILRKLLLAPPIPLSQINEVSKAIKSIDNNLPLPVLNNAIDTQKIEPIPCLHLSECLAAIEYKRKNSKYSYYYGYPEETEITVAKLYFKYGKNIIPSDYTENNIFSITQLKKIYRDFETEVKYTNVLTRNLKLKKIEQIKEIVDYDFDDEDIYYIGSEVESLVFIEDEIPKLKAKGWIIKADDDYELETFEEEELEWYSELGESEYDWFSLNLGVMIDDQKVNLLPLIVEYLKNNDLEDIKNLDDNHKISISLSEGRNLLISASRIKSILAILTELYDDKPLNKDDLLILPNLSASQLDNLEKAIQVDNFSWLGSKKIRELGNKIKSFKGVKKAKLPKEFNAKLRPYQQQGVNWLRFLNEYELGGILADDMGLGKTIQTLANLIIEKNNKPEHPSIIIAPTSLVANWAMEAEKFAPSLKVLVLHGDKRQEHFDKLNDYDVVITSYPLVIRDQEILKEYKFNYIILDEAQIIKNHKAKVTRLIYDLKSKHRLCLTGTPLENHLGELWSQFRFLAPGLLGTTDKFKRLFQTPIEKHNDISRRNALANRIKPFLLRRTKSQVAIDLPPKTEIIKTTSLEGPQRDVYESIRLAMDKKVREAISKQGLQKSHIIVLDALLKLRQTCCDPRLLKIKSAAKAHGHSAKLNLLMELIPSMIEEGRKILLFSQFTSMISLIEQELNSKSIEYVKLVGSTKDRATPIKKFQEGNIPVFLISLKSGGVGLNLTAADTIIHYDPWWNPAVENQATDRAHRIGQDKPVFVYKLVTEGTVEETILEMQQKKKSLVEGLLSENQNTKKPLKANDLNVLFKPLD